MSFQGKIDCLLAAPNLLANELYNVFIFMVINNPTYSFWSSISYGGMARNKWIVMICEYSFFFYKLVCEHSNHLNFEKEIVKWRKYSLSITCAKDNLYFEWHNTFYIVRNMDIYSGHIFSFFRGYEIVINLFQLRVTIKGSLYSLATSLEETRVIWVMWV